jgi:hypothetical protein
LVLDKIEHALRIANSVGMPGHVGASSRKGRNSKTSIARRKPAAKAKRIAS